MNATVNYVQNEKSAATRRSYAFDWDDFERWCRARAGNPLPAHQGIVAAYLADLAQRGMKAATIGRRCNAIAYYHRQAGHEPPTNAEVKAVMRGIRRSSGTAPAQKTAAIVRRMVDVCPAGPGVTTPCS